jgi:hypothetical protein
MYRVVSFESNRLVLVANLLISRRCSFGVRFLSSRCVSVSLMAVSSLVWS